ncbi:MAG: ABC transporter ATP-binding protein [Rhodospirillales bacterium]|jgi:iron complex transport system ATP-binding protein|nr:ABC transporter ATP-binding protein [Rhodospirillales bacterium]
MIEARALSVTIGGREVVAQASIAAGPGDIVGLIGPNGAGKTSLLRALLRLVAPTAGEVRLNGIDITPDPPHRHARDIAYLPQGQTVAWPLTVRRLVALGRAPHRTAWSGLTPADEAAVARALAAADAAAFADRPVTELSGGERARVLLARALAVEAPVLLADEPMASLDPYHQLATVDALRKVAADGAAVIVVLHDLALAARSCTRLCLMDRGRVIAEGAPEAVLTDPNLATVYRVAVQRGDGGGITVVRRLDP